uniref:Uncharacterized protein n=1 Tax=Anopheles atroparvus TaxID=41427 RepID=A0A182JE25_ANOAO
MNSHGSPVQRAGLYQRHHESTPPFTVNVVPTFPAVALDDPSKVVATFLLLLLLLWQGLLTFRVGLRYGYGLLCPNAFDHLPNRFGAVSSVRGTRNITNSNTAVTDLRTTPTVARFPTGCQVERLCIPRRVTERELAGRALSPGLRAGSRLTNVRTQKRKPTGASGKGMPL